MHKIYRPLSSSVARLVIFALFLEMTREAYSQVNAASQPAALPQSVVVLRSGQVLKGQAALRGDEWVITVPEGEIRIRPYEVECCCSSIEDAYSRLRAGCSANSVYDHLRLAQWCIRQQLLKQAEQEIADVAAVEPKHPMIDTLRRRMEVLRAPPAEVTLTSASMSDVSGADLERMARGVPPGTLEMFVRWVQPLVINNCSTAGCHGSQSESSFRLSRFSPSQPPSRSVTLRNFHAVLECLNYENPAASKLLTTPLRPHGTAKAAIFTDPRAGSYARIVEWAYRVTNHPYQQGGTSFVQSSGDSNHSSADAWPTTTNTAASRSASMRSASAAGRDVRSGHSAAKRVLEAKIPSDGELGTTVASKVLSRRRDAADNTSTEKHTGVQRSAPNAAATPPADPFDPEVFNRQSGSAPKLPGNAGYLPKDPEAQASLHE